MNILPRELYAAIFDRCTTATLYNIIRTSTAFAAIVQNCLTPSWHYRQLETELKALHLNEGLALEARKINRKAKVAALLRHSSAFKSDPSFALDLVRSYLHLWQWWNNDYWSEVRALEAAGVRGLQVYLCDLNLTAGGPSIDGMECVDALYLIGVRAEKLNMPQLRRLSVDNSSRIQELPLGLEHLTAYDNVVRDAGHKVLRSLKSLSIQIPLEGSSHIDLRNLDKLRKVDIFCGPFDVFRAAIIPPADWWCTTVERAEQFPGGPVYYHYLLEPKPPAAVAI